jgi:hypothetical protein
LEDLRIVCGIQNQDVDLHRLLGFVKDTLLIEAWQVISSLKHIDGTQGVMFGGHDEVEESDGLVEELMVVEHGLLQELALPL